MSLPKSILIACLVVAGCATQQETADQPAEACLGPGGLTIATLEPGPDEVAPSQSAATSSEDDKWLRIADFLAHYQGIEEVQEVDAREMLGLWDEKGHFRRDYWEGLTHKRRNHCVDVLALCGNGGAIRARRRGLSEDALRKEGPSIANGTFGTRPRGYLDDGSRSGALPVPPGRVRISIDPILLPDWKQPNQATLDEALDKGLPLVIYFPPEIDWELGWADVDLAKLSRNDAVFIKIPFTEDRDRPAWFEESVVPDSKVLSDNPSREYDVSSSTETVIVADSHGNECFRLTRAPKADDLKRLLDQVADHADRTNAKLQANLDKARAHLDKGERRDALKFLLKNFREDVVGLKAQLDSIVAYHKIIEEGRTELAKLVEAGDKEGLKALAKEFANTDLEKEIDEAIEKLK